MLHTYIDLRKNYLIDPGDAVVYDVNAIMESISNILETPYYTRLFNRGFGSKLLSVLFMPVNQQSANALLDNIIDALVSEPRIYVDRQNSYVTPDPDHNAYSAQIKFVILFNGQIGEFNKTFLAAR